MYKKLWVTLALVVIVPGLLFTVACAKKTVKSEPAMTQTTDDQAAMEARAAQEKAAADEAARQAELDRQRQLEAQRLRDSEANRQMMAARNMFMNENIYFEFDSSVLIPAAQEVLKQKADWMQANPDASVIIEGHCDERGTPAYNLALVDRRAESAKAFLTDLGIDAARLATISYGEERPVDMGHNEEAWAKNRRAQFVVE
jgi:peptidoglycan-associated lipoprotein